MKIPWVLAALVWLGASGCQSQCQEENECLQPDQCSGAPNLQRYTLSSGQYRIEQSDVGHDGCLIGRRNADLNGLAVDLTADGATDQISVRIGNGLDLGSGARNPQPSCNSFTLSHGGVAGNIGGCTYTAAFSSQLILMDNNTFYLSITEEHNDLQGTCPISEKSCTLLYGAMVH
jgi:hypothetical protein